MSKNKFYRIKINSETGEKGDPCLWVHNGQQIVSTLNRPQAALFAEDAIEIIKSNGFEVEILETFEAEKIN